MKRKVVSPRMDDSELCKVYEKHVACKSLYRIVPERFVADIKKNGLNPDDNPFEKQKSDIKAFCKLLLRLHKEGFIMMRWWGKPVDQATVVKTTLRDLDSNYIDFTPASHIDYYLNLKGGALAQTISIYSEELLMKRPPLSNKDWKLVKKLSEWSKGLSDCENYVLIITRSSRYLEHAWFEHFTGDYVESPFGSYTHFKKVVTKHGLSFYEPYLSGKKLFYLRTTKRIPPSELAVVKK